MKFLPGSQVLIDEIFPELTSEYPDLKVCRLQEISGSASDESLIVVEEGLEPEQVVAAFNSQKLRHLVQKNKGLFEKSLVSVGRLIGSGSEYFRSDFHFSDEPLIAAETVLFQGPQDKDRMKSRCMDFVSQIGSSTISSTADAILEELYMNAVIDAPREAAQKGIHLNAPASEIHLCRTEKWLQISCTDPYGSLEVAKFLGRMEEVYTKGAGPALKSHNGRGAGLGCVILFEQSTCLILGVQPGCRTKVTCMVPLGISNRQRVQMRKSLHWFQFNG